LGECGCRERFRGLIVRGDGAQVASPTLEANGIDSSTPGRAIEGRRSAAMQRVDDMGDSRVEHGVADDRVAKGDHPAARLEQTGANGAPERVADDGIVGLGDLDDQRGLEVAQHRARDVTPASSRDRKASIDELADRLGHGRVAIAPRGRSVVHLDRAGGGASTTSSTSSGLRRCGRRYRDEVVGRMRVEQRRRGRRHRSRRAARISTTSALASQGSHRIVREQRCAERSAPTVATPGIAACIR
jgi:hypothetical protein